MIKKVLPFLFSIIFFQNMFSQNIDPLRTSDYINQEKWVDSIYNKMTLEEKIGQLFMVQVFTSSISDKSTANIKSLVSKHHIGGVIFSTGTPENQAKLTNELQEMAKVPLLVAMDAEWGLSMRLDATYSYPWNMTLGALKDNSLVGEVGQNIGIHCKRLGVNINFAPDVDINTNANNPIIGSRSFGQDKTMVSEKGVFFTKGMQSEGVLACAKHFPGHGDTSKDSHKALPTISFSRERLEQVEMEPFRKLISSGVASVMIGHLSVPSLDKTGKPSSLSYSIVTKILKNELGFNGLIFTDALAMKGVSSYAPSEDVSLQAFLSGNDVLLMPDDVLKGISKIKQAYKSGILNEYRLKHSVKKILKAKYWAGLNKFQPIDLNNLREDLNSKRDYLLSEKIFERAVTLVKNSGNIFPIKQLDKHKIAYLELGDDSGDTFYNSLSLYDEIYRVKSKNLSEILKEVDKFDRVIIGFHKKGKKPWDSYKMYVGQREIIEKISDKKETILAVFTSPYSLLNLQTKNIESIVISYQNNDISQSKTAQAIFGAFDVDGVLPVDINHNIPLGSSIKTSSLNRLSYGIAESVGMDSGVLHRVDSIVESIISQKMTPSAQVLVARRGKVIYNKSFGTLTYDSDKKVYNNYLYDLASLTKILGTVPELIRLYDLNKISVLSTLSSIIPELKGTNKEDITLIEALSHYARLISWIPFYQKTIPSLRYSPKYQYYQSTKSDEYPTQVAEGMYIIKGYKDSIFNKIAQSNLRSKRSYLYSDLPYYILQRFIEKEQSKPLNDILDEHFYKSMGANNLTFLPLVKFDKNHIVPTEKDMVFRKQTLQGYVHDQGAAMMGGVGGHAGLFGNANDVAKVMQMFLQKGYYGGVRYFSEKSFDVFNKSYFAGNRRALGFDKPQPMGQKSGPTCGCVSDESFGHSGFTGTYAWADPKSEIVYVFLSNRIFPSSENKKLITSNVRSRIQQVVQDAIID